MRKPKFAGLFYPKSEDELKARIKSFISPDFKKIPNPIAIVSPHAGYEYSGKAAAAVYYSIQNTKCKNFIILCPNHTRRGSPVSLSAVDWETPLGTVKVNKKFIQKLSTNYPVDESAHEGEHSLEVQLPFLQYFLKDFKIVPISLSSLSFQECEELAKHLSKLNALVIASSDFTHYGFSFGFLPFLTNVKENLEKLDSKAIDLIKSIDAKSFYEYSKDITICGRFPITVSILFSRLKGAKKAELISHYSSGDLSGDYSHCVDYASLIFL